MSQNPTTGLIGAPPPTATFPHIKPDQIEFYVRAGIHQDRTPGNLLVVAHPGRLYKLPRGLLEALENAGFTTEVVETLADRRESVKRISDAMRQLAAEDRPLDLLVVSGDGSLDHHVLIAAYLAFYPELVAQKEGDISYKDIGEPELASLPADYRQAFFPKGIRSIDLDPSEETIRHLWLLRAKLESDIRKGKSAAHLARRCDRPVDDPMLRVAIMAVLFPHKVVLRAHGFDVGGLAQATAETSFKGLYPFIRSISTYPAGTAADNAVFAGVPGWGYAMTAGILTKLKILDPLRKWLEGRVVQSFLRYYLRDGVVVPARISAVGFDGDWQSISSHAAGGPGAGHFFSADLTAKTKGLLGYLKRIPAAIVSEGILGSTIVRVCSRFASGKVKSYTEGQMGEGLYTNRTFIGGVGSVPTTDPTSFAGQSSLCVIVPIWYRNRNGQRIINLRGFLGFWEAIFKGISARLLHVAGIGAGTLAGGGKFAFLAPEHQVAIKEGEQIDIDFFTLGHEPRAAPVQVSGDPFQAYRLQIRSVWGPIPVLADARSLLLSCTRRSLADLRLQQSYRLDGVYIGGVHYFVHRMGQRWDDNFSEQTGLLEPPRHLPLRLATAQQKLIDAWQKLGTGDFVDTTESGLKWGRAGRFAHSNDQRAHLLLIKEPGRSLLVRQMRAGAGEDSGGFETRTHYRIVGAAYIIHRSQTIFWRGGELPKVVQEEHYFRNAEEFQQQALTFFPMGTSSTREPSLNPEVRPPQFWESLWESESPTQRISKEDSRSKEISASIAALKAPATENQDADASATAPTNETTQASSESNRPAEESQDAAGQPETATGGSARGSSESNRPTEETQSAAAPIEEATEGTAKALNAPGRRSKKSKGAAAATDVTTDEASSSAAKPPRRTKKSKSAAAKKGAPTKETPGSTSKRRRRAKKKKGGTAKTDVASAAPAKSPNEPHRRAQKPESAVAKVEAREGTSTPSSDDDRAAGPSSSPTLD